MPGRSSHTVTALEPGQLKRIHDSYLQEADDLTKVYRQAKELVEKVHAQGWVSSGSGWAGEGSKKFFWAMEREVLPTLERVPKALELQAKGMEKIVAIFSSAEKEIHGNVKKFRAE